MQETILQNLHAIFSTVHPIHELDTLEAIPFQVPCKVKKGLGGTTIFKKWDFDFFARNYGHIRQDISTRFNQDIITNVSISDYIRTFVYGRPDAITPPYYLKAWDFLKDAPGLADDIYDLHFFSNWLSYLPDEVMAEHEFKLLFIGMEQSSFNWHYDSLMVNSWSGLIKGRKLWVYLPEKYLSIISEVNKIDFTQEVSSFQKTDLPAYWGIQEAGDIMYTAAGWLHHVINLDNSLSVTENFINHTNIDKVIAYLDTDNCSKYENLTAEKTAVLRNLFRQLKLELMPSSTLT